MVKVYFYSQICTIIDYRLIFGVQKYATLEYVFNLFKGNPLLVLKYEY